MTAYVRSDGQIWGATLQERIQLLSRRDPKTDCWIWQRSLHNGYGQIRVRSLKEFLAHRVSYIAFRGPIPGGLTVDHKCFTPPCVNPAHLQLMSNEENASQQLATFSLECRQGHPWTEANTYRRPSTGRRECRTCAADGQRRRVAARRGTQAGYPDLDDLRAHLDEDNLAAAMAAVTS